MRMILSSLALLALTAITSAAAPADRVQLKNGEWMVGTAKHYDSKTEILTFIAEDGTEQTIKVDELSPRSAYRAANSLAKTAEPGRVVRIGNFARDIGLYAHAARHYRNALKADPSLQAEVDAEFVTLRREAAVFCMSNAEEAIKKGDSKEAEKWLTTLVTKLPDEPLADKAATLLEQQYAQNHDSKDDELEKDHSDLLTKELKTGKMRYDSMLKKIQKGLTARNSSAAKKDLEGAYKEGERALKEIDKVEKELEASTELKHVLDGYRVLVKEHMIQGQLALASFYTTQTSYQQAASEVNKALALDSKNKDALAARARIEQAAGDDGWGWR
jgi:tetratricopeptide (TPR) repeat protein